MSLLDLLPSGVSPDEAVTAIAAAASFAVVCMVWQALLASDPLSARAKRLRQRRDELRSRGGPAPRHAIRAQAAVPLMRSIAQRFNLLRSQATVRAAERLACAGWRSRDAVVTFMLAKLCLPFAFGLGALALRPLFGGAGVLPALAPLLAVGLGACAADLVVKNAVQRRQKAVQKGLPDALDLLIICVEAGLSLEAALHRAARELALACPEVADELGLTAIELGFLPERRQALGNLAKRCPLPAVRGLVNALLQTERYGTPLAKALRVLAAELRNDRMMRAEEKAARLPAILTVPMIIFILPALLIVLMGPAGLRVIDTLSTM